MVEDLLSKMTLGPIERLPQVARTKSPHKIKKKNRKLKRRTKKKKWRKRPKTTKKIRNKN
jgi:hypothetical protein